MTAPHALRRACMVWLIVAVPSAPHAQDAPEGAGYRVVTSTLDGGTPQASGDLASGHVLRGTIGQPDAVVSNGGPYRLEGGFWPADKTARGAVIFADGFDAP